jgi:Ca2+-dependent lipid-binding protein
LWGSCCWQTRTKSQSPEWEHAEEFMVADVNRVRFVLRVLDMDSVNGEDGLGDADVDVSELFDQQSHINFGRRTTKVGRFLCPGSCRE